MLSVDVCQVGVALGVLETMARGPLAGGAAERLRAACANIWRARTLCEALSLTGYGCIHPDQSVIMHNIPRYTTETKKIRLVMIYFYGLLLLD